MKKQKFYKVFQICSDGQITILPETATFDTDLEALQFISDYNGPFYQLTILPVYE